MLTHSTYIQTYKCTSTHSHILTHTHTCILMHIHLRSHMLTHAVMHKLIQSHTHSHAHLHTSFCCTSPTPPVWQLMPPEWPRPGLIWCLFLLFALLVLFIFLSHNEHVWRRIYFHPIWKHISSQPWARQISVEAPGHCHMDWEGRDKARMETSDPQGQRASWSGLLPLKLLLDNPELRVTAPIKVAERVWYPSLLFPSAPGFYNLSFL